MKRETIFKTILILMVGVMLFVMPLTVFAAEDPIDDLFENQGGLDDLEKEKEPTPELETQPTPSTPTPKPEESIPHAGVAEDTMMIVTIAGLVILATVAYKKLNEYQNI